MTFETLEVFLVRTFCFQEKQTPETYTVKFVEAKLVAFVQGFSCVGQFHQLLLKLLKYSISKEWLEIFSKLMRKFIDHTENCSRDIQNYVFKYEVCTSHSEALMCIFS